MKKIQNPEKESKKIPEKFSSESKIERVTTEDYRKGVILDSVDEFGQALIVYSGGSVEGSGATQKNLLDAVGESHGTMAVGLTLLSGAYNADDFTERLVQEATSSLQGSGRFRKDFDYDAMGTNFFKTTVDGKKVGDKYVLELNAAYVGDKPEKSLAERLEKSLALVRSDAIGKLSVVDDWWFNANLFNLLGDIPISKEKIPKIIRYIEQRDFPEKPKVTFEHEGKEFDLDVSLNADTHLRPENGERGSEYFQLRGSNIVGGAWATWDKTGNNRVAPRVKNPSLELSVSLPGERYSKPPIVEPQEMKSVQGARDYLAKRLQSK